MEQPHAIGAETHARRTKAAAIVRQRESEAERARRRIRQVESMIADLDRLATQLEADIEAEQARTRNHDPAHYAYSTFAKSLIVRRDNLRRSSKELHGELIRLMSGLAAASRPAA
jgi:hypothetical protein